jgi:hypothetical protein
MTRNELQVVKKVLMQIQRKPDEEHHGKVKFAISLIDKDLALREAQRDNFKANYAYDMDY